MTLKRTCLVSALFLLVLHCAPSNAADIWYEDNNLGRGAGMPVDFVEKFKKPESFSQATKHIDVYLLRANVLQKMDDDFFTKLLFPYLRTNGIKLALNAGGATWYGANSKRHQASDNEIDLLRRIKRLGGTVDYISLQSVLSKPLRGRGSDEGFSLERRIAGIVAYSRAAREVFPDAAIGIIDALPAKGLSYKEPYKLLAEALAREQIGLSYIHLDVSFDAPKRGRNGTSWESLREVESFVENDLKVAFGLFATSRRGGNLSSQAYFHGTVGTLNCFAGSGGTPREYIVASWFPYPEKTIPDTAAGSDYPTMRVVLEFGQRLDQIQQGGPEWSAQQRSSDGWRTECGVAGRK